MGAGHSIPFRRYALDVGPVEAAKMLKGDQQTVDDKHVADLARRLVAGQWRREDFYLVVDPSGAIVNGRHRLLAIIRSGRTVRMSVTQLLAEQTPNPVPPAGPRAAPPAAPGCWRSIGSPAGIWHHQCLACGAEFDSAGPAPPEHECRPVEVSPDQARRRGDDLTHAVEAAILNKQNGVTAEEIERRLAVCRQCSQFAGNYCSSCKCRTPGAWFAGLVFDSRAEKRWTCGKWTRTKTKNSINSRANTGET